MIHNISMLAGIAALVGFLFGYDTAVISGTIGFVKTQFNLGWEIVSSCA